MRGGGGAWGGGGGGGGNYEVSGSESLGREIEAELTKLFEK
jgi:hypothetical protein